MPDADSAVMRSNPLSGLSLPHRVGVVAVSDPGPAVRFILRGSPTAFGVRLSATPMRAVREGEVVSLWLGPDEWMVLAPDAQRQALAAHFGALAPGNAAVDVSHRAAALVLDGPAVCDVLSAGCPLDFDLAAFPVGMCTRTIFGKAEVALWREGETRFRLDAGRSYLPYVVGLLGEAVRDVAV